MDEINASWLAALIEGVLIWLWLAWWIFYKGEKFKKRLNRNKVLINITKEIKKIEKRAQKLSNPILYWIITGYMTITSAGLLFKIKEIWGR